MNSKSKLELNKLFASNGGRARAKKLTKKQRSESARKAAQARWDAAKNKSSTIKSAA